MSQAIEALLGEDYDVLREMLRLVLEAAAMVMGIQVCLIVMAKDTYTQNIGLIW